MSEADHVFARRFLVDELADAHREIARLRAWLRYFLRGATAIGADVYAGAIRSALRGYKPPARKAKQ